MQHPRLLEMLLGCLVEKFNSCSMHWSDMDSSDTLSHNHFARIHSCPVREAVSYRGLFTAGWFGVREKHCSWLEIYERLQASDQAEYLSQIEETSIAFK